MNSPEDIKRFKDFTKDLQGKKPQGDYEFMSLCPAHGDANTSLWTKLTDGGKIHVDCKAGCSVVDVVETLGFKMGVLYGVPQIEAVYGYEDAHGALLYEEIKYDKKTSADRFNVRRINKRWKEKRNSNGKVINSKDKWIYDTKGLELVLYNLLRINASDRKKPVFMCEGAKDAKTLANKNLISTAALLNDWNKTDTSPLDDRHVIIMVDNDEAGEMKALKAAHDRYGKSLSVKLLRLPDLNEHGDVTDWFEAGGKNTIDRFLSLAGDPGLPNWFPYESIRENVEAGKMTGLAFESGDPIPIFETWLETFHAPELGALVHYDKDWLKGNVASKLYKKINENPSLYGGLQNFLRYTSNKKSKDDERFKPVPMVVKSIIEACQWAVGISTEDHKTMPIFIEKYMPDCEKEYDVKDIAIMKTYNFYIPKRLTFPRSMQSCIAMHALPFDYDPDASCPTIVKAFDQQWGDDRDSIELLLQYMFYCMACNHEFKSILSMVGPPNTGKSQILNLIAEFVGKEAVEAISLGKMGNQFELYRARFAKLLACDDENATKRDLQDGAIVENLNSIAAGGEIRIERKGGDVMSRVMPGQIIICGNTPLQLTQNASGMSERLKFLVFRHVFTRGRDMDPNILKRWVAELPGLMNLVLDAGERLMEAGGFIEPKSSHDARSEFESGPIFLLPYIKFLFEINKAPAKKKRDQWRTTCANVNIYYKQWCADANMLPLNRVLFTKLMLQIGGITKGTARIPLMKTLGGKSVTAGAKCWLGIRRIGSPGDGTEGGTGGTGNSVNNSNPGAPDGGGASGGCDDTDNF